MAETTIGPSGSKSTIQLWVDDFGTLTEDEEGLLEDGATFSERVRTNAVTTGASAKLILRGDNSTTFDGTEASGAIVQDNNGGSWGVINLEDDYMECRNFEITQNGSASGQNAIRFVNGSTSGDIDCDGLLIHNITDNPFWQSGTIADDITVSNCVAYEYDRFWEGSSTQSSTHKFYYNTAIREFTDPGTSSSGIRYAVAKNNIMLHHGDGGSWGDYMNLDGSSANNLSHDTTGSAGLQSKTAADTLTDPSDPPDMTLKSGSAGEDAGATISGFTVDIAGNTRGASPDLGAFETQSASAGSLLLLRRTMMPFLVR